MEFTLSTCMRYIGSQSGKRCRTANRHAELHETLLIHVILAEARQLRFAQLRYRLEQISCSAERFIVGPSLLAEATMSASTSELIQPECSSPENGRSEEVLACLHGKQSMKHLPPPCWEHISYSKHNMATCAEKRT